MATNDTSENDLENLIAAIRANPCQLSVSPLQYLCRQRAFPSSLRV